MNGTYHAAAPLANVTIAGANCLPKNLDLTIAGQACETGAVAMDYADGVLHITGLEHFTQNGAWEGGMTMKFE